MHELGSWNKREVHQGSQEYTMALVFKKTRFLNSSSIFEKPRFLQNLANSSSVFEKPRFLQNSAKGQDFEHLLPSM